MAVDAAANVSAAFYKKSGVRHCQSAGLRVERWLLCQSECGRVRCATCERFGVNALNCWENLVQMDAAHG